MQLVYFLSCITDVEYILSCAIFPMVNCNLQPGKRKIQSSRGEKHIQKSNFDHRHVVSIETAMLERVCHFSDQVNESIIRSPF